MDIDALLQIKELLQKRQINVLDLKILIKILQEIEVLIREIRNELSYNHSTLRNVE